MNNGVSCIIRTCDEAKHIGRLIEVLYSQKGFRDSIEIVVVDSGSIDDTVQITKQHDVKLIEIPRKSFHFSKSLNLGVENSTGDLIAILSAHAIPCTDDWLQKMVYHFEDEAVAGVCCRQIPWSDADLYEVFRIERTFGKNSMEYRKETSDPDVMTFSNAASCIRRSVWHKHPFDIIPAAEDWEWAKWAIENGYTIVYEAEATVHHSHSESCRRVARRLIEIEKSADLMLSRRRGFFLTTKQAVGLLIRGLAITCSSELFKGSRVRHFAKSLLRSFWYVADFDRKS